MDLLAFLLSPNVPPAIVIITGTINIIIQAVMPIKPFKDDLDRVVVNLYILNVIQRQNKHANHK